jgi:diguanylate cyclase (GGDEF)-like protein/PAS domain S-box-containing protein
MGLLRGRADAPDSLAWLASSPVRAACLGLWADDGAGGRVLDVVSAFGDAQVPLGQIRPAEFPPPSLVAAADRYPGSMAAVLAVKSGDNDWGLLAIVGPPESRTLSGRETYFAWAAMLGGALDYEVMLDSLRRQREDLAHAYGRERALTEDIRASEERYALAAAAANDGLWDWDLASDSIFYSARWKSLIGHSEEEVGATPGEWLDRVHPEELPALTALIEACRSGESDDLEHEHRLRAHDGTYRWVLCRTLAIPGHGAPATRLVGSLTDITERHHLEEQLRRQAMYDTLTGLPNRPLFLDRLDRALARQLRGVPGHFAVVFLDLDGFKLVNDSLGHAAGDALLQQAAQRISAGLRGTDTAARIGGDEFTVLLEGLTNLAALPGVVRKLQESIGAPYEIEGNTLVVTASAGVATSAVVYGAADDVLRDADIAMYRAKSREPGSFLVFDPSMHDSVVSRLQTESRLRRAIDADELVLYYQPIVDLRSEQLVAMEGLIRWPQHDGHVTPPGEFLPIAQESGLIVPIGRSVIRQACQQIAAWRSAGVLPRLVPVSINVSHREFWHPELADHLMRTLRAHDLTPDWLAVEITEGVLMGNVPEAQRRLEELHCMGIRLHIDDFGTGYSSLEALHQFPIDALKIDRSFVSRLESDPRSRELVSTILTMARGLDIDVIAEGVETAAQQRVLVDLGCATGQGYLFARPAPALDLMPLLLQRSAASESAPS